MQDVDRICKAAGSGCEAADAQTFLTVGQDREPDHVKRGWIL
jgi:hypothetical protein